MKKPNFIAFSALITLISLCCCGLSPMLHHADATPATNPILVSEGGPGDGRTAECALKLEKTGLCIGFKWESELRTDDELAAAITLTNTQGEAVDAPAGTDLAVQLWMPSMGHGSSPVRIERQGVGAYRASGIYFIMPGLWEVRLQLKHAREIEDQAAFEVRL
jgi:hypothetical protein